MGRYNFLIFLKAIFSEPTIKENELFYGLNFVIQIILNFIAKMKNNTE